MSVPEPKWIEVADVIAFHDRQIAQHGGASNIRDFGGLEAAVHRPRHLYAYGEPDMLQLAASYAYGIAMNHPFVDGNKRASFLACVTFLDLHGIEMNATEDEAYDTWIALAEGKLSEVELSEWLTAHVAPEVPPLQP